MTSIIPMHAAQTRAHDAPLCPLISHPADTLAQAPGHKFIPTPYVYERPEIRLTANERDYFTGDVGSRVEFHGDIMPSGGALFAAIESHDDYYVGEEEADLLKIIPLHGEGDRLVVTEFGPGSGRKTLPYVQRHQERSSDITYQAIDVSQDFLDMTLAGYDADPLVSTRSCCADFFTSNHGFTPADLGLFVGTTISNFEPDVAIRLLRHMRASFMKPGGLLLLGQDGNQDPETLQYCYDDRSKITATFVLNALCHIRRDHAPDLRLGDFEYKAYFDPHKHTMHMGIVSRTDQTIDVGGRQARFTSGEFIRVGQSRKYPAPLVAMLAAEAGFEPLDVHQSRRGINVHVLRAGRM